MSTSDKNYRVIGTRPIRHDGVDKVTGRAQYCADVQPLGLVYGKVVRSPVAHARVLSVDVSPALALPGVLAAVTAVDFPNHADRIAELGEGSVNLSDLGANCLAREKVLYKGHAVAAIAATSQHIADEAAKLVRVAYELFPVVVDLLEAMQPDAPLLHENNRTDSMGKLADKPSNISRHLHFEKGKLETGFAAAEVIVEREYRTASVHQGYIEPQVATAFWNNDGHLTVWASTQGSFTCRQQTAELLAIPVSKVTVIPCEIGGGFGGKIAVYLEPVAAMLSRKCGRPVRIAMRRDEVLEGTGPTPGSVVRVKIGATKDGRITAAQGWLAYDAGAFPGGMIGPGCMCVFSCYDIPHVTVDGYDVLVNKPKSQAYRAPGATQAAFACESAIDELAQTLGMCPLELRLRNAAKEGTQRVDGADYPRVGLVECLEAAKNSPHWKSALTGPHRGRGIACGFWFNIGLKSSVTAHVNADGTVQLLEGSTDIGGTRTSIAMQLAERLGITASEVLPRVVDTDSIGYTDVTGGSRTTFATGLAAIAAAADVEQQMLARAAKIWQVAPETVSCQHGIYTSGKHRATFAELAALLPHYGGLITGQGVIEATGPTNGFGVHVVDLEVCPDTAKVTILRYTAIQDAGKAIHPSYVEGQMQGGVAQGIGWALHEEYQFDEQGRMLNPSFLDYRMPTTLDVPMIETIIVEVPNPDHPYGVRGVGETPIVPPPGAIANAVQRAAGVRMTSLPMSPPRLWQAMQR
jgi:CO/xanthine dehydrogenase Mo-binding subunit